MDDDSGNRIVVYNASPTLSKFHRSNAGFRGIRGPVGCLSGDTEFLGRNGWVRMDAWNGAEVAQWDAETNRLVFVVPEYIDVPADELIEFDSGSLVMRCSPEHRVPHYDYRGRFSVKTAEEIAAYPSRRIIPTTFAAPSGGSVGLSDDLIRFAVMMHADGYYPKQGKQAVVCVRKDRKKERIRYLLKQLGVEYTERTGKNRPTETTFTFYPPYRGKHFDGRWWQANEHELCVVLDEFSYWDGLFDHEELRFSTSCKGDADYIQYAAHATGRRASIGCEIYERQNWRPTYSVRIRVGDNAKNRVAIREHTKISRVPALNGRKYCFTVPTGFFLARYRDTVFLTGNSGKTSGCINEIMIRAHAQHPSKDGVRRTRWAAIRNSYGELKSTTIQSWIDWFGENKRIGFGQMVYDTPIRQEIRIEYPDHPVQLEMWFLSADREDHIRKFKSLEVTGVWLNEASELIWAVVEMLDSRHGRYPSVREKPDNVPLEQWPTWHGMIADTNSPITRNWYHQKAEVERPEGWEFFAQPGGLDEKAENINNLPGGRTYYTRMMQGKSQAWIDQFVNNQYGSSLAGKRVYPEFNDRLHVSPTPLKAYNGLPLRLGWDFGLTPAVIIGQLTPRGQLRILGEICATDMGIERFAGDVVVPFIRNTYPDLKIISRGDPGGNQRAQTDEKTCLDLLAAAGIPTEPAPTNLLVPRLTAVRRFLTRLVDGEPGFLLDPSAVMLREGFNGGYHYPQLKIVGDPRYKEEPDKNEYSHPHDGLHYLCLDVATDLPKPKMNPRSSNYRGPADRTMGY